MISACGRELRDVWCLIRQGMEPHVTLIWFVHPQWFQELGAFAKDENIDIFVDWCETCFKLFGALLSLHRHRRW